VRVGTGRQLDLRRVRESVAADNVHGRMVLLDQGAVAGPDPMPTVCSVCLLDGIVGPDLGKAHINLRAGYLAPSSVAFKGRKSARFCWVS
jgi:hypothetical protein